VAVSDTAHSTRITPAMLRAVLVSSDERDRYEGRILAAWREGYRTGWEARADDYDLGFCDGAMARKHAQHDLVAMAEAEAARWHLCCKACRRAGHRKDCRDCQDRTRGTFGDPMPGDYPGSGRPQRAAR
jgi:hypothetical protein